MKKAIEIINKRIEHWESKDVQRIVIKNKIDMPMIMAELTYVRMLFETQQNNDKVREKWAKEKEKKLLNKINNQLDQIKNGLKEKS